MIFPFYMILSRKGNYYDESAEEHLSQYGFFQTQIMGKDFFGNKFYNEDNKSVIKSHITTTYILYC